MSRQSIPDPDDMFADTRMTFGEHIEDLRTHLLRALYGFLIFFVAAFFFARPILRFIADPVEKVLADYHYELFKEKAQQIIDESLTAPPVKTPVLIDRSEIQRLLGVKGAGDAVEPDEEQMVQIHLYMIPQTGLELERLRTFIRPPTLTTLSVQEAFVVYIYLAILTGLVVSSPWVFWQIWSFVAAGLYPHEKRLVHVYLPLSLGLFIGGVLVCQFYVIPKAVEALLWFNKYLGLQPDLRLSEWLGFAIMMPLVFGISFQTPIVMLFMERVGVFDVQTYREKRKFAIFFMAVFSAVITPSVDVFSMMLLFLPLCLLYELGIWMCALSPRPKFLESELEESDDLIEV